MAERTRMVKMALILVMLSYCRATCVLNTFLRDRGTYPRRPLKMLNLPVMDTINCKGEWNVHQTCCDARSVASHIADNEDTLVSASGRLVDAYSMFNGYVTKLFDLLKKASLVSSSNHLSNWTSQHTIIRSILTNGSNLYFFEKFADVGSPNSTDIFRTESVKCWTHMRQIRVSAICSACSANSSRFFVSDKGLVQPEVCRVSLDRCFTTLRYSFKFVTMMKWLHYLDQQLNNQTFISLNTSSVYKERIVRIATTQIMTGDLSSLVGLLSRESITSHQFEISICKRFLSLGSIPFIYYLEQMFVNINAMTAPTIELGTDEMTMIMNGGKVNNKVVSNLETELSTILSNWKNANPVNLATGSTTITISPARRLRMLQTAVDSTTGLEITDTTQLFTSDLLYATSQDSLFTTSLVGVSSSTTQPLNLTLTFP